MSVTIAGDGFGAAPGSVLYGTTAAAIQSWFQLLGHLYCAAVANGSLYVQLEIQQRPAANTIAFTVLTAKLIPVTFTVNNANPTNPGDYIFVTGNTVELGNWGTTFQTAIGPMLDPNYPNWFSECILACGPNGSIQVHRHSGQRKCRLGRTVPTTVYTVPAGGTSLVTCELAVLRGQLRRYLNEQPAAARCGEFWCGSRSPANQDEGHIASATCNCSERFCFFVSSRRRPFAPSPATAAARSRPARRDSAAHPQRQKSAWGCGWVLMPPARRRIDAAHRGQRGKPNGHPDAADGETAVHRLWSTAHQQAYASNVRTGFGISASSSPATGPPANQTANTTGSVQQESG